MAAYLEQQVLIDNNIFLKTYRATEEDYKQFQTDINEQLRLGLLFDDALNPNSLNTLITTYQLVRNGLYLNKAQQVSLDYKDENKVLTKAIFLTKDHYLKLKSLSAMDSQDRIIKVYQRLQKLITENTFVLKNNQLDPRIFTFEMYRDRVLGLFDTLEGDFPNKADKLLKGYQKSYEEAMEVLEDLVTSNNPLRSGYYRMYNESPEVHQTVNAFKRALIEKAAIEANDRSEFKTMELGLMKLLQYGSLDERLRKQILALIQQNAEGVAKVVGGANENYAQEIQRLLASWKLTKEQIQKPMLSSIGESIGTAWKDFSKNIGTMFKKPEVSASSTPVTSSPPIVETEYLKQLETDLTKLSEEVNKILPTLNPLVPEDQLKFKMYEELLANLELLLGLIMDIKDASVPDSSSLKTLYKNLREALQKVIEETKELNDDSKEITELMTQTATALGALTDLPSEEALAASPITSPFVAEPEITAAPDIMMSDREARREAERANIMANIPEGNRLEVAKKLVEEIDQLYPEVTELVKELNKDQSLTIYPKQQKSINIDIPIAIDDIRNNYNDGNYIDAIRNGTKVKNALEFYKNEFEKNLEEKNRVALATELESIDQMTQQAKDEMDRVNAIISRGLPSQEPEIQAPAIQQQVELPPMTPIGRRPGALPPLPKESYRNPAFELNKSPKQAIQEKIKSLLTIELPKFSTYTDPKFTIKELNQLIDNLSEEDKPLANLLRIAFVIANIQENAESNDRDMDGLNEGFFSKMIGYFDKSRLPTAYANIAQTLSAQYPIDVIDPMKQIQIDLYCMLVDQLFALHNKPSFISTYTANTSGRSFKPIDTRGADRILLDTILPKFKNDSEPPLYEPSYVKAAKTYAKLETYFQDLGDTRSMIDGLLNSHFMALNRMDNDTNRRNFLSGCIDYIIKKYKTNMIGKQILYKLLVGKDSYGNYDSLQVMGGDIDINLSQENKDMDGGAEKNESTNPLENIKKAIEKLDEYRKTLRITQEELNSWKEKFATYDKSVDITKNFKPEEVLDKENIQTIKIFAEDLEDVYQNVLIAQEEDKKAEDELKSVEAELITLDKEAQEAAQALATAQTKQPRSDEDIKAKEAILKTVQDKARDLRAQKRGEAEKRKADAITNKVKAEEAFKEQLEIFLKNKFALTSGSESGTIQKFVSILKKVLPGEISVASSSIESLSKQLLSIKDFIRKIKDASQGGNYYTDTEIVSIYEFLKGKSADLKKFNTERFNAIDKTLREIYQFVSTTNKPLETKEKFKEKRFEFESLMDGSENVKDNQRFKDLLMDETKKSVKGLLPTIKDIKRLMETDIDYFTSLFQQKATSILKQQELERQREEIQVRKAQPGPFAIFGQQKGGDNLQMGGAEIDTETRHKLKNYFGLEEENDAQYKEAQLYLDTLNKLIDNYKFALTTITDPAAALSLSGDKSLFNMIYEKYLKSAEDETKGTFIASQELSTALDTNNLIPRNVLRVSLRDKIIILFTTLFMRLITLSIVEFMIEKGVLKNLKYTILAYLGFFSILFIAFTALINLDLYRLRIVFNYLNFHANADKVYSYLLLLWLFGGIIYYIIVNVNPDINVTTTSEDVKARLIYRIQVLSLIIWLFLILMVFIF